MLEPCLQSPLAKKACLPLRPAPASPRGPLQGLRHNLGKDAGTVWAGKCLTLVLKKGRPDSGRDPK